ncbi:uncharacterized protein F5891DRAFT_1058177 [Suillus fuscotomentosus]|uniref:Uncharacterized protein n=1 Tax=Suillus fuscotomentosus TaxID=1912939 RepID=A0AAD4DWK0_9AGAM|nr:uncharacterized protein F5891DRAFT_1058177 [Suillus fuscotomentosus]KAG1895405.1 hypothetical protein F5891DRAFT_1058177 [Suillus fuscotomentosus]
MSSALVPSSTGWQRIMDQKHEVSLRGITITYGLVLLRVNKVRGVDVDPERRPKLNAIQSITQCRYYFDKAPLYSKQRLCDRYAQKYCFRYSSQPPFQEFCATLPLRRTSESYQENRIDLRVTVFIQAPWTKHGIDFEESKEGFGPVQDITPRTPCLYTIPSGAIGTPQALAVTQMPRHISTGVDIFTWLRHFQLSRSILLQFTWSFNIIMSHNRENDIRVYKHEFCESTDFCGVPITPEG